MNFLSKRTLLFALAVYTAAFVGVVIVANTGNGSWFWSWPFQIPYGDKLGHVLLLGIFSALLNLTFRGRRAPGKLRFMMLGSLLLIFVMTFEESSQLFNHHRNADPLDWLGNLIGIMFGEGVVRILLWKNPGEPCAGKIRPAVSNRNRRA